MRAFAQTHHPPSRAAPAHPARSERARQHLAAPARSEDPIVHWRGSSSFVPAAPPAAGAIQAKLAVNQPGDEHEREADRVSERVMRMPEPRLQRACACGGGCPQCQAERRGGELPRAGGGRAEEVGEAGALAGVHEALRSPGQPLDADVAEFFAGRFGHGFHDVRVHADGKAAESARAMSARAYTVGRDLVFGSGEYQPGTAGGRRLLAHELTHVVQQAGSAGSTRAPVIQRACLPDAECATPGGAARPGSAREFGARMDTLTAPGVAARQAETPQVAQAGGYGLRAVEVEKLFRKHLSKLAPLIHSIFIDDLLPADAAAGRVKCLDWASKLPPGADRSAFTGAGPDSDCIRVPKQLEDNARQYRQLGKLKAEEAAKVQTDLDWFLLRLLTHEVTHVRFNRANTAYPSSTTCTQAALATELGELAAVISEYPYVKAQPSGTREVWANEHLLDPRTITKPRESIFGAIFDIRCTCECADADALIQAAFTVATSSWSEDERKEFHAFMKRGEGKKFGVYWPYDATRIGRVGRNELSLSGGIAFSEPDQLRVAMLTYRRVLTSWAEGRWRITGGAQLNLASLQDIDPKGEFGAGTVGVQYVSTPVAREKTFGGFRARVDTGFGLGEFSLRPAEPGAAETTERRADWILEVGAGVQFYIPRLTDRVPVSVEAALRMAQPLGGGDAERVHTANLSLGVAW